MRLAVTRDRELLHNLSSQAPGMADVHGLPNERILFDVQQILIKTKRATEKATEKAGNK
jgi:hypothetical protein